MQHINVLLIEDNPSDVRLVWEMLVDRQAHEALDLTFHLICAERLVTGLAHLRLGNIDIVLLDLMLPDSQGLDTLLQVVQHAPDMPVVVLTSLQDHALAIRALHAGAFHYLAKGRVDRQTLAYTLRAALAQQQQQQVRSTDVARFHQLMMHLTDGVIVVDQAGRVQFANRAAETFLGRPASELLGTPFAFPLTEGATIEFDITLVSQGATPVEMHTVNMEWEGALASLVTLRDISARKHTEQQQRQAHQTEAVKQLAGGIANEFNNVLTAIVGYSNLLAMRIAPDDPLRRYVEHISQVSERAAQLTRQLSIISRQHPFQPQVLAWNAVIKATLQLIQPLLGETITLVTELAPQLGAIRADPSQLQQLLMNLLVNAQNAMPQGGTLSITTANVNLDRERGGLRLGAPPGPYAMLQVRDTGLGMLPEVLTHLFEPFFTTKTIGKGPGLGLAVVYSIVEQNAGDLEVQSRVSEGTTFRVYLPRVNVNPGAPREPARPATVLLVEDDPLVRNLMRDTLERAGYHVLAATAGEALQLGQRHTQLLDVVVTDVVLPGMLGRDLVTQLREQHPALRVLFMSGQPETRDESATITPSQAFLPKPFTPESLVLKVREILETS